MRYFLGIISCIIATLMAFYSSHYSYAQNNTTINLSVQYAITGSVFFTGSSMINTGGYDYSSGQIEAHIISSTGGTSYRSIQGSGSVQSGSGIITGHSRILGTSFILDGTYTIEGYLESYSHGRYPLSQKSIIIDHTGPSRLYNNIPQTYTAIVGDTISINRSPGYDSGVGGPIRYSYDIRGISPSNIGTILIVQSSSTYNPLNTTILPLGIYSLTISAYDILGNMTTLTGMSIEINPTQGNPNNLDINNNNDIGGGTPILMRDICLCGDYSSHYYDRRCSEDHRDERMYMNDYCNPENNSGNNLTLGGTGENTSSIDYIQTVISTLAPNAHTISYTQSNQQSIIIDSTKTDSSEGAKKTNSSVLGYSISRGDNGQSGGLTLFMDILKTIQAYNAEDVSDSCPIQSYYHTTSGRIETMWGRLLGIRYCSERTYIIIIIIIIILIGITCRYTNIYSHRKKKTKKSLKNGQKI